MAEGYSKTILLGEVVDEPEFRALEHGSVLKLRVSTTESYTNKDGELKEYTDYHTVVTWGKQADAFRSLAKGSQVLVEGKNRTRSYEKDGAKRYVTEVRSDRLTAMSPPTKKTASTDDIPF